MNTTPPARLHAVLKHLTGSLLSSTGRPDRSGAPNRLAVRRVSGYPGERLHTLDEATLNGQRICYQVNRQG